MSPPVVKTKSPDTAKCPPWRTIALSFEQLSFFLNMVKSKKFNVNPLVNLFILQPSGWGEWRKQDRVRWKSSVKKKQPAAWALMNTEANLC